jgi:hypothetical protein
MNLHVTEHHESEAAGRGKPGSSPAVGPTGRFAYASGARPLSGYTIKRGIGHGGFGEVYFATSDAGKEVAIKLIRRNLDIELRGVTQCLNLKHPNLIALYDVRQDDEGDNWVVMELVAGESLEDVLNRHPNGLPQDEVLSWIHGISAGVAYLHDHGIVHRDLKPGNIFIDEGFVKIGDYGLSKFISCSRRSGQTGSVGTVHYMAPEIANGRYGKEIDIYALGIILYEMLTGHVPFEGESVGEILMKHLTAEPDVSGLPEPYRTIISRALAKDLQKRFTSVGEMIAMLPPPPVKHAVHFAGPAPVGAQPRAAVEFDSPKRAPREAADSTGFSLREDVRHAFNDANSGEPIARMVRQTWYDLSAWWEKQNFQAWQKLFMLVGLVFAAITTTPLWAPALGVLAVAYLVYRIVRAILIGNTLESEEQKFDRASARTAELAGLRPVYFSIRKALLWLFCSGAAMTVAAQTIESQGNFHRVLNNDDLLAVIPIGGLFVVFGFLAIKAWRGVRRLTLGPRAILPGRLYFSRRWIPWLLAGWVGGAWLIVGLDQGIGRVGDEDLPIVAGFMGIIAASAAALSAVYRAAVPMSVVEFRAPSTPRAATPTAGEAVSSSVAASPPRQSSIPAPSKSESSIRRRWNRRSERLVLNVSPRERFVQLVGSLLLSGVVCVVVALVMMILRGEKVDLSQYAWLAATSILGAWAVLVPAKIWESASGDAALRRFAMLVIGLGFGLFAFGIYNWLLIQLPYNPKMMGGFGRHFGQSFYGADGGPTSIAFLAYFGFLFVLLRWWRLADPLRATRLSIWHTAVAVFWGTILSLFWPFPQPWGLMVAATVAVSVQLAAPWISSGERGELLRKANAA